ncbi:hypothetical protein JZ751_013451, partial [Albula glossodonta]
MKELTPEQKTQFALGQIFPFLYLSRCEEHHFSVAMESVLGPPLKLADAVEQIQGGPSPGLATSQGGFSESVGASDRIPLVKPYLLKKKDSQRRTHPKCLRSLDPILASLLSVDSLGEGDGIFASPKSLRAHHRHLCTPVGQKKQSWRKLACPADASRTGQDDTTGQPHSRDPSKREQESLDVSHVTSEPDDPRELPQGGGEMGGAATQASDHHGEGIFQGKSEEASLDLVFDFLTQLQYHTHQAGGVAICTNFLRGECVYGSDCAYHHTVLPYHWQVRHAKTTTWRSLSDNSQDQLERLYCNPDNQRVQLKYLGRILPLDFSTMQVQDAEFDEVRRLTTPPCSGPTPPDAHLASCYQTVWKYYCKDSMGWRAYSEPVVRLIEEASGRGLKEVRFVTLQSQYVLNLQEGFQQNAVFGLRHQVRRRPLFLSSVLLAPYLQTLGGLSSSQSSSSSPLPSPTMPMTTPTTMPTTTPMATPTPPRVFPETWLPMEPCQDFLQVPVSPEDRSYRTVYSLFHRTVPETRYRILSILRVQNPFLWEKYKRKKEYMSRKLSETERGQNERHLFHGTSQDAVEGICKHNFDPRVCGKHATVFGQGSYFARKAVYSHNFSKRSPTGVHYMFLAKVLTGRFALGNARIRRPPPLHPSDPSSDLYNSCVDNWVDPQIFVIFNDDQSYPYFIIQYEEVSGT